MGEGVARTVLLRGTSRQIAAEIERLRGRLVAAQAQQQLAAAFEAQVRDVEFVLRRFHERLEAIEQANDMGAKRERVQLLVSRIRIDTEIVGSGRNDARITINYTAAASRSFAGF